VDNLNYNLSAMAMIFALGPEYAKFASSLVCFDPTCSEVIQAFICKHNHHLPCAGGADNAAYCAHVSPLPSNCCLQAQGGWTTLRNKLESTVYEQTR
jgi:hypothetical protein